MKHVDVATVPFQEYTHPREGTVELQILMADHAGGGVNFTLAVTRYGAGDQTFSTPRHRHTFEQIRWALSGSLNYARGRDIPEGWVCYFPEGAFYGPQEVDGGTVLLLQFGVGYLTEEEKKATQETLRGRGEFRDGIYTYVDPSTGKRRNKDAVEALWEEARGQPLEYPEPRYPEPILMNPAAFAWRPCAGGGAEAKTLATFTERQTSVAMVRGGQGDRLTLGAERAHLIFTTGGGYTARGETAQGSSALFSELGEELDIELADGFEGLLVGMPIP